MLRVGKINPIGQHISNDIVTADRGWKFDSCFLKINILRDIADRLDSIRGCSYSVPGIDNLAKNTGSVLQRALRVGGARWPLCQVCAKAPLVSCLEGRPS